jgi:hypothetical protein
VNNGFECIILIATSTDDVLLGTATLGRLEVCPSTFAFGTFGTADNTERTTRPTAVSTAAVATKMPAMAPPDKALVALALLFSEPPTVLSSPVVLLLPPAELCKWTRKQ